MEFTCIFLVNNTLFKNNANFNNWVGITLDHSDNNTLSGNDANYNNEEGAILDHSDNNIISGNDASYNDDYGIYLSYSGYNTISGNDASYNGDNGICLSESGYNTISGNDANHNDDDGIGLYDDGKDWYDLNNNCITLYNTNYNIISGNDASYNGDNGITLFRSCDNIIYGNNACYNYDYGIDLDNSYNNTFSGNIASYSYYGINLEYSCNNTFTGNDFSYNYYGIFLYYTSNNNSIYFNNIYGNSLSQIFEHYDCIDNQWDNGSTGNYWGADYTSNYPNAINDGIIWSIPYEIHGDGSGIDHYPLVNGLITYIEDIKPQFTNIPEDFSEYEGYTNLSISWIVTDSHPASYTIELNGSEVVSTARWRNGSVISYNIPNGLLEGEYNITLIVIDKSGNTVQNTIIFTVTSTESTPGFSLMITIFASTFMLIIRRKKIEKKM